MFDLIYLINLVWTNIEVVCAKMRSPSLNLLRTYGILDK